jgi:pyridoxal phosphate enzyme (YggS family)
MSVQSQFVLLRDEIPKNIEIIAVTKFQEGNTIMEVYHTGHRVFGENKVQEIISKKENLPNDIQWHMIGHLQTNKVKNIVPFISMIHSVDSFKLLKEINSQAVKYNRVIDCLLQFHIASEETKFGLDINEASEILESHEYKQMQNVKITGVMGMASFSENAALIRKEFRNLKGYFDELKQKFFTDQIGFRHISMGMSNDYQIAIEEGSTMLRIGSKIFIT